MSYQLFQDIIKKQENKWVLYVGLDIKGAEELAIEGGEDPAEFHVTLLYGHFNPNGGDEDDIGCRIQHSIDTIKEKIPETLVFDSEGRFEASESSDGKDVIFANVKEGQLETLHKEFLKALKKNGLVVEKTFEEYHPHMTLAYIDPGTEHKLKDLDHTATIKSISYGTGEESSHEDERTYPLKKAEEPRTFNIMKTDDDKRLIFGWASVAIRVDGEQVIDHQNDLIDPEDLEEAVYEYVLNFRDSGEEHIGTLRKKAKMVESCIFTKEKMKAMGIPEGIVPEGWWIGFYVEDDEAWKKVKSGIYQMFSIEGQGVREAVEDGIDKSDKIYGCGVLVVKDGKILTGTRIDGKHKNQICGPGGHVEPGEEPEEAAIREAYEEFGIKCKELTALGVLDRGRAHGKSAIFLCTEFEGEPETDEEEMTDCKWRSIHELEEAELFEPFEQSLALLEKKEGSPQKRPTVAKTFNEILEEEGIQKFNPFHDALGRFSNAQGFASYSANPKTRAGQMALGRSQSGGHGMTRNVHRQGSGGYIANDIAWLGANDQAGLQVASAAGSKYQQSKLKRQAAQQTQQQQAPATPAPPQKPAKPATPPKPQKNYDKLGYADHDDADYHQLYNGKQYYQQQKLTAAQQKACTSYLEANPEPGSLYSHSQNMNYQMATGQTLTGKYKQTHDGLMSAMHNLGYNVELTRYDHDNMVNGLLSAVGAKGNISTMSISQMKKALVGTTMNEDKFLSVSYNDFKNAPQQSKNVFMNRMVKITYKAKAGTQAMMPGNGPGGNLGELILAPTNGKSNPGGKIVDVKYSGNKARKKGTQILNQNQVEIVIEI